MNTYLVIEARDFQGRTAFIRTVDKTQNLKGIATRVEVISISAYTRLNEAQAQVRMLLELYKQQKEAE